MDSRNLEERKEELKQQVLDSFLETFPQYKDTTEDFDDILFEEEEVQSWKEGWLDEIEEITDIEKLKDEFDSEKWKFGIYFIEENDFEETCKEDVKDCGYISRDFPSWIEIDWEATANNMRQDYLEVEFRGETYLYR